MQSIEGLNHEPSCNVLNQILAQMLMLPIVDLENSSVYVRC